MPKYCPNCGKENETGSKFCIGCGERISRLNDGPISSANNNDNDATTDGVGNSLRNKNGIDEDKNKQKILIGVVAVLIIAIAIAGAFAYVSLNNNDASFDDANSNGNGFVGSNSGSNNGIGDSNTNDNSGSSPSSSGITSSSIPLSEVYGLAVALDKKAQTQDLSTISSVEYGGVTFTKQQCLYIFAKAIDMKNSGANGDIAFGSYKSPDSPLNSYSSSYLTKSEYVDMAQRTCQWMDSHGKAPNYTGVYVAGSPDFGYDYLIAAFALVIIDSKNGPLVSMVSW